MPQPRSRVIEVSTKKRGSFRSQLAVHGVLTLSSLGVIGGLVWFALREAPVPEGCPSREEAFGVMQRETVQQLNTPAPPQPHYRARTVDVFRSWDGVCVYGTSGQVFETWQGRKSTVHYTGTATWKHGSSGWVASAEIATED